MNISAVNPSSSDHDPLNVVAVYELPVPIWVMRETLGRTYSTGIGRLRFDLMMPEDAMPADEFHDEDGPDSRAPRIDGLEVRSELAGVTWSTVFGANMPDSLSPATAVQRVLLVLTEAPTSQFAWRGPAEQLAGAVGSWFDALRTWVETMTGQDLDPHHRVFDVEAVGDGLTFVTPPNDSALGIMYTLPIVRPIKLSEWTDALNQVAEGAEPPQEEILSRDARASHRRHAFRRTILDSATAVELVLSRRVREASEPLEEKQRKALRRATLGKYVDLAAKLDVDLSPASVDDLRWLTRRRNEAAHEAKTPDADDAFRAVQMAIDFLGTHGTWTRAKEREPDGSEWVPVDPEDL